MEGSNGSISKAGRGIAHGRSQPAITDISVPEKHFTVGTGSRIRLHFNRQVWRQIQEMGLIELKSECYLIGNCLFLVL